jgi:hypothetical protein
MLSFAGRRHFSLESLAWIGRLKSAATNDQVSTTLLSEIY